MRPMLGYLPSPEHGTIDIGPLSLHAYGLMLAIGVLVAARIADVRWRHAGNTSNAIGELAVPVVVSGVIGARIYHLFTGYKWSEEGISGAFQIWKGGLSIWGAVAGGLIAVVILSRRRHLDALALLDAMGPAVVVAQAIGRWGNWFNQELFGKPSTLPWALEIDQAHRPVGYELTKTFQPTFLYESIWCLLIFATIVWLERHRSLVKGQAFALYVAMYTFGRIFFEWMRVDPASKIFGVRFNLLLSAALCVAATVWFARLGRNRSDPLYAIPADDQGSSG
jgi:prolipoprotein diacylglyceryl transferase